MFHRVPYISAMAAGIAVLTLVLAILSPSPSLLGTAHAQTNNAPIFDDGATTTREVEETPWNRMTDYPPFMENSNRDAGDPVAATDTDSGDTLTYSLDGTNAEYFKIDESSGQIRTKEPLDYENDPAEYTVTVSVHDGTEDATITVTITLTDVNEPPKPSRKEGEPQPDYDGDMEFTIPENTTGPMVFFLKDPEGRGKVGSSPALQAISTLICSITRRMWAQRMNSKFSSRSHRITRTLRMRIKTTSIHSALCSMTLIGEKTAR